MKLSKEEEIDLNYEFIKLYEENSSTIFILPNLDQLVIKAKSFIKEHGGIASPVNYRDGNPDNNLTGVKLPNNTYLMIFLEPKPKQKIFEELWELKITVLSFINNNVDLETLKFYK